MARFLNDQRLELLPLSYGFPLPMQPSPLLYGKFPPQAIVSALSGLPFAGSYELAKKMDVMHATDHMIPSLGKLPVVATIMDAIPMAHPEWVSNNFRSAKNWLWRRSAQSARHVITISEYSKQQIHRHFKIPSGKISVTPLGVDARWFVPVTTSAVAAMLERYALPDKFFLTVGTLQPRKNIARVIDAYQALAPGVRNQVALVIVGRAGWQCEELVANLERGAFGKSVRWLKHVPDEDLVTLVSAAEALIFPSLYEGFGLPVVEGFAAGTPVITSSTTALPEVAGDAALLVNPLDALDIANAMQRVLEETGLADSLREKGTLRAREHSWERTASLTFQIYERVASDR
ncbi:glycosyltransferase family 1 protein [Herbaspirillum sp. RTI4]|uniref:glycosyltransferase family 4 protein n=1 Tax=Herbaspirillum sp. RTI4 TaxID=3048640 RepID=UPI002AB3AB0E|nr:glycosyltransferase family 1 protein [Herbaspirillum sp. RTI4]MDY7577626.1 glycosyltransferase family 1 protein [Herbaspirillum sp. RTI4]MEA9982208.1 glycosyltransferase family 1 protein [Herbaspirillum sp. RTI4]